MGLKDPGIVVVDEVVGQWVTLTALPFTPLTAAVGFLLFRAMDIVKPWPARDLERVPRGWGIMADDVAAGDLDQRLVRGWPSTGVPGSAVDGLGAGAQPADQHERGEPAEVAIEARCESHLDLRVSPRGAALIVGKEAS